LAVADALDKARHFVLSCISLIIAVNLKPLLEIFNNISLDGIPNNGHYHFMLQVTTSKK